MDKTTMDKAQTNMTTRSGTNTFQQNEAASNVIKTTLTIMSNRQQPLTATLYLPKNSASNDKVSNELSDKLNNKSSDNSLDKPLNSNALAPALNVQDAIMIAPATGIKRQFYNSFATHLASDGFAVLTYDNEGIGDSLTSSLRKCDASLISWGRHDMPAVLEALQAECPNARYHLIGHSAGGQLIGLMPNHADLSSVVNIACSSGQIANMALPFKAQAMIFMDVAIPVGNLLLGYTPSDKLGMGEPLPRGVAKQWRDWCNGAGYIKTAFGDTVFHHFYDEIDTPSLWLNFTDDDIANKKNLEDMTRVFTNMPIEKHMINPKEFGLSHIGHMKYFSSKTYAKAPQLWEMAIDWIKNID